MKNKFTEQAGVEVPLICGAMYPCSNPELVAAASESGALGIVQPLSLTYVHGYDFRKGLQYIRTLTKKPIGLNVLVEKSSAKYAEKNMQWVDIALDEGVRFFITALGNPKWVVDKVHARGGVVYHDVVNKKWAEIALSHGIDGLICVNNRAGGHAGTLSPEELLKDLKPLGKPLICAGGVGDPEMFKKMLAMGFDGVQMGTRFIATTECTANDEYKQAILKATADDVILTDKLTGVPVSVINTDYVKSSGAKAGPLAQWLLSHPKLKHYMRLFYMVQSTIKLKRSLKKVRSKKDYWQAGKSVDGIESILPVKEIVKTFSAGI